MEQQTYDAETIEKVYEDVERKSVMPSFGTLREGYKERDMWDPEFNELYEGAESLADLRESIIRLDELRNDL